MESGKSFGNNVAAVTTAGTEVPPTPVGRPGAGSRSSSNSPSRDASPIPIPPAAGYATLIQIPKESSSVRRTTSETTSSRSQKQRTELSGGVKKPGPGRKPRACTECKKQKMKCEVLPGQFRCRNCHRRNLECGIKHGAGPEQQGKTSQPQSGRDDQPRSIVDAGDYTGKLDVMRLEIQQMKDSIDALVQHSLQTRPSSIIHNLQPTSHGHGGGGNLDTPQNTISPAGTTSLSAREDNTHMAMTRENSLEPMPAGAYDQGAVTVDEPMGSLYEVTRLRNIRSNRTEMVRPPHDDHDELDDFISKGVISEAEAEELYKIFHTSLNHYLWVGLDQTHPSFESVRKSSELLTATILTVTALHIPTSSETFDKCYKEFLSLISSSMFSRYHCVDDVRGLCIAAFWLSEVSWKLSGHAIRIATELNIHQSFSRALEGDRDHFLRARLWYMLYVCDHHFSIAYGRPPMIAESQQIREHETFLASPFADALDQRICSQVNLMQIMTRIYGRFSERRLPALPMHSARHDARHQYPPQHDTPATAMLSEEDLGELRNFNLEIDQWRMRWHPRQATSRYIGTFPPKGIILYSYFAKLQLNSLAVRGVSLAQGRRLSTERKEFANMGISAAASILTFVLEEADLRRALVGTPLYVHTMIAFASVFLMKMAAQWNRVMGLNVESGYVSHLLRRMVELLKSSVTSDRHLLYHIAAGLEKMLAKLQLSAASSTATMTTAASSATNSSAPSIAKGRLGDSGSSGIQHHMHPQQREIDPHSGVLIGNGNEFSIPGGPTPGPQVPVSHSQEGISGGSQLQQQQQQQQPGMGIGHVQGDGVTTAMAAAYQESPAGWDALSGTLAGQGVFTDMATLNNTIIYEAFGSESANDVYNLLTSQFSY